MEQAVVDLELGGQGIVEYNRCTYHQNAGQDLCGTLGRAFQRSLQMLRWISFHLMSVIIGQCHHLPDNSLQTAIKTVRASSREMQGALEDDNFLGSSRFLFLDAVLVSSEESSKVAELELSRDHPPFNGVPSSASLAKAILQP